MIRRVAREMVLQSLFQVDFSNVEPEAALEAALVEQETGEAKKAYAYAETVLKGTLAHLEEIDGLIGKYAVKWNLERMAAIDRSILRMAVYEMRFAEEKVPVNIEINEAVELAKEFGEEQSSRFINGVLGAMMREEPAAE